MVAFPLETQPSILTQLILPQISNKDTELRLPDPLLDKFKYSPRQHKLKAEKEICKDGQCIRFISMFKANEAYFYSLQISHIGLSDKDAQPHQIYDHEHIKVLKKILRKLFKTPYYYFFQVGKEGKLHVHLIAGKYAGLTHLKRDGELCKRVYDFCGLFAYAFEPQVSVHDVPVEEGLKRIATYYNAKNNTQGNLPTVRGFIGVPYKQHKQS